MATKGQAFGNSDKMLHFVRKANQEKPCALFETNKYDILCLSPQFCFSP
jgi:hypothetical protein